MRAHETALFCLVNIKTDPAGLSCTANKKKKGGIYSVEYRYLAFHSLNYDCREVS